MMTTINDLNDDCLLEIMDKLALRAKFAVQRVNSRWRRLTDELLANTTELTLSNIALNRVRNADAYHTPEMYTFFHHEILTANLERFLMRFTDNEQLLGPTGVPGQIRKLTIISHVTMGMPEISPKSVDRLCRRFFRRLETIVFVDSRSRDDRGHDFRLHSVTVATPTGQVLSNAVCLLGGPSFSLGRYDCFYIQPQDPTQMVPGAQGHGIQAVDLVMYTVKTFSQLIVSNRDTLQKVRCHVFFDSFDRWVGDCLERMLRLSRLEALDVSFGVVNYKGGLLDAACKRFVRSGIVLESLKKLSLGGVSLTPLTLKTILQALPNVSSFALTNFSVFLERGGHMSIEREAKFSAILNAITTLSSLKSLTLEYYIENKDNHFWGHGGPDSPKVAWKRTLQDWLIASKFPNLRRLASNLFGVDATFELFCRLAVKKPEEGFAFKIYEKVDWDGMSNVSLLPSTSLVSRKPRNVRFC